MFILLLAAAAFRMPDMPWEEKKSKSSLKSGGNTDASSLRASASPNVSDSRSNSNRSKSGKSSSIKRGKD